MASSYSPKRPIAPIMSRSTSRSHGPNSRPALIPRNTSVTLDLVNSNFAAVQDNSQISAMSTQQIDHSDPPPPFPFLGPSFYNFQSKNRPRGESDLGRPAFTRSKTNGFGFPAKMTLKTQGLDYQPSLDTSTIR